MFDKILIANRGEIACRVIKSARNMGIKTVAVYSDADSDALHVQMADEAIHIGPPASTQSYLLKEKILQACVDTGAQAVHPGYGFLSENAEFCNSLATAGIAFIGPKTRAIEAMGDKITSKRLADEAGVNTIPGCADVLRDAEHAVKQIRGVSFGKEADIIASENTRQAFSQYVSERFSILDQNGELLELTLLGSEIDGNSIWVYQETPIPADLQSMTISHNALRDIWIEQVNRVNIERNKETGTLIFQGNIEWLEFEV